MADGGRIPRVVVDASALRSLPLSAADGFVLSRIDGKATERELASLTGLPEMQIRSSLDKLFSLKVIDFGVPFQVSANPLSQSIAPPPNSAAGLPPAAPSDAKLPEEEPPGGAGVQNALLLAAIAAVADDAAELAEEVELSATLRRRVLGLHSVVTSLDHYALLAIDRNADRKEVKRAYFGLAAVFHPDRYFRKNLGSFKSKMENIFGKVSTAYETLWDKERRAEYDAYLGDVEKSRDVESMLRNVMAEVESAEQSVIESARSGSLLPPSAPSAPSPPSGPFTGMATTTTAAAPSDPMIKKMDSGTYSAVLPRPPSMRPGGLVPGGTVPPSGGSVPPASDPSIPAAPRSGSSISDQLRREALARRLKVGRPVTRPPVDEPARVVTAAPPAAPRSSPTEAVDALKRRYEERVEAGRRQQGDKYMKLGEEAESKNDLTAAAASYRVALPFLREDEPAFAHAKDVIARAEIALGETYLRQAQHEERSGKWEEAVRSWARAAKLRPTDHVCQERYANALVKTAGDLHEASQAAQKAVALAPTVGDYRCTLASVYIAANLMLNARRELESAAQQFPDNPNIPILLKKITKPG